MQNYCFTPIAFVRSCFKEKFGIPRQAGLVPDAPAVIRLPATPENRDAIRGMEAFSHLWVVFVFHDAIAEGWNPLVRPPRLGGAKKVGVYASRSPHRPNPVGMSVVEIEKIAETPGAIEIHVRGGDLLEGTPVLDLKPYVPYADSRPEARAGWAEGEIPRLEVRFSPAAASSCTRLAAEGYPKLEAVIREMVALDPRPAFQKEPEKPAEYAAKLFDFDVHWRVDGTAAEVLEIRDLR